MGCNCIKDMNKKLKTSCLDIALIDSCLNIEYSGCACGEFEEIIEINYCPICGKKIIDERQYLFSVR